MENTYTARIQREGNWWIGWVEEVPGVNCQERTRAELIESLREALHEILDLNREAARRHARADSEQELITAAAT